MKNRLQESGSAHVAVVVVLIVALIGALGFIFWQNFIQRKDSDTSTNTTQSAKSEDTRSVESRALALNQWGVSVPLTEDDPEYVSTYEKNTDEEVYLFSVKDEDFCEEDSSIGVLWRAKLNDVITEQHGGDTSGIGKTWEEYYRDNEYVIRIDGYVYVYSGPQSVCSEPGTDKAQREVYVADTLKERVAKLKPLK